jgi:hypothetical protein
VRVASNPYIGHGTFAAAGGGFCGAGVNVNSAVDEPRPPPFGDHGVADGQQEAHTIGGVHHFALPAPAFPSGDGHRVLD